MKKRLFSGLLAILLVLVMMPVNAHAASYTVEYYDGDKLVGTQGVEIGDTIYPWNFEIDNFNALTLEELSEYKAHYAGVEYWRDRDDIELEYGYGDSVVITGNKSFEVTHFICTISYKEFGTEREMGGLSGINVGSTISLEDARTEYIPEGKVLDYWDCNGIHYHPGDDYSISQNVTLYAVWEDAPAVDPDKVISEIVVSGITAPVVDSAPQAGTDFKNALQFNNDNIEIEDVYWEYNYSANLYSIENSLFRANTDYRLRIEIKTKNGYTFANNGQLLIKNNEGMLNRAGYVAYCEFDDRVVTGYNCEDRETIYLPFTTKTLIDALPVMQIYWDAGGVMNWYAVDGAADYLIKVVKSGNGEEVINQSVTDTRFDVNQKMEEEDIDSGSYKIKICARDGSSVAVTDEKEISYNYTRPVDSLPEMAGVSISEGTLRWDAVSGVAKYIITIDGTLNEVSSSETSYDLKQKLLELGAGSGDYTVKIKAVGSSDNDITNECSRSYNYHVHSFELEIAEPTYLKEPADCTSAAVYYKSCACHEKSTNDADTFTYGAPLGHSYVGDTCVRCGAAKPSDTPSSDPGHSDTPSTAVTTTPETVAPVVAVPGMFTAPAEEVAAPLVEAVVKRIIATVTETEKEEAVVEEAESEEDETEECAEEAETEAPESGETEVVTVIDSNAPTAIGKDNSNHAALLVTILAIVAAGGVGAVAVVSKKVKGK